MAAQAGVKRFVYVSTIKVNGESTSETPFNETSKLQPSDPYSISKWEAENELHRISAVTGMEVVIVRPPLVYGPGVGGNFISMLKWIDRGIPLPLASVNNRRSFVGINNLVSLLMACLSHPQAAGEVLLVSDGEDISTPELLRRTSRALGKSSRLFPFPISMLRLAMQLLSKSEVFDRLCGSLTVDISKTRRLLGWNPVSNVDDELRRTAKYYLHHAASISASP
jgi:UDP-glucose 4-epimerase